MSAAGLPIRRDLVIPEDELHEAVSRSGGPGGQNVNKVASRVSLRWSVAGSRVLREAQRARLLARLASRITRGGELIVHVDSTRSQLQNREEARRRLAELVRAALVVPRARKASRPTAGSRARRREGKRRRSDVKRQRGRPSEDD
jgi:ribosome-associated protein